MKKKLLTIFMILAGAVVIINGIGTAVDKVQDKIDKDTSSATACVSVVQAL